MIKKIVKYLFVVSMLITVSYAGLVDGVALIVNNSPITLFEIRNYSQKFNLSSQQAVQMLIKEKIEEALIKKYGITADSTDVDNEIEKISSRAGMSMEDFENYLEQKGVNIEQYRKSLAKEIEQRKLYKKITSSRIRRATQSEMKSFYQKHIDLYSIPQMVDVIQYTSSDKQSLEQMKKNPILNPGNITQKEQILKTASINPKLMYVLQQTKEGSFTPILTLQNGFTTFYVKRKINVKTIPYDKVENDIFAKIMDQREKNIIQSYFDKLVSEAKIVKIR